MRTRPWDVGADRAIALPYHCYIHEIVIWGHKKYACRTKLRGARSTESCCAVEGAQRCFSHIYNIPDFQTKSTSMRPVEEMDQGHNLQRLIREQVHVDAYPRQGEGLLWQQAPGRASFHWAGHVAFRHPPEGRHVTSSMFRCSINQAAGTQQFFFCFYLHLRVKQEPGVPATLCFPFHGVP